MAGRIIKGERDAPRYMAELLRDRGRFDEAERVLREDIAAGHALASAHLTDLLDPLGQSLAHAGEDVGQPGDLVLAFDPEPAPRNAASTASAAASIPCS
jgi:hypothetical protein